jgi:hypothetical protein
VTVEQIFPVKTADGPTDMIAQGAQAGSDHGRLLEKTTGDSSSHRRNKRCLRPTAVRGLKLSTTFASFCRQYDSNRDLLDGLKPGKKRRL